MCEKTPDVSTNVDNKTDKNIPINIKQRSKIFVDKYIIPIILSMIATLVYNTITLQKIDDRLIAIESNNTNNININFSGLQPTDEGKIDIKYDTQYLEASIDNDKIYLPSDTENDFETEDINIYEVIPISSVQDVAIYSVEKPSWKSDDIIAINTQSGEQYTAKDLSNQKILLPYKQGNQECYFYGQYNENNQWDGDCVVNIYENNNLVSIMESKYKDGILLAYKQVFQASRNDYDVWSFSDRINYSDYNEGKTWSYFKSSDYSKKFIYENVTVSDILYVNDFETIVKDGGIEEYYYGRTSNGFFNDITGTAYLVKYFQNGFTRLIYCGHFKNGYPDDQTGNAWHIAKSENTTYMYYKGYFQKGKTTNNSDYIFENNLTQEEIKQILNENHWENKQYKFEIKLDCSYENKE